MTVACIGSENQCSVIIECVVIVVFAGGAQLIEGENIVVEILLHVVQAMCMSPTFTSALYTRSSGNLEKRHVL